MFSIWGIEDILSTMPLIMLLCNPYANLWSLKSGLWHLTLQKAGQSCTPVTNLLPSTSLDVMWSFNRGGGGKGGTHWIALDDDFCLSYMYDGSQHFNTGLLWGQFLGHLCFTYMEILPPWRSPQSWPRERWRRRGTPEDSLLTRPKSSRWWRNRCLGNQSLKNQRRRKGRDQKDQIPSLARKKRRKSPVTHCVECRTNLSMQTPTADITLQQYPFTDSFRFLEITQIAFLFRQNVRELYVLQEHIGGAECHLHPCLLPHDRSGCSW